MFLDLTSQHSQADIGPYLEAGERVTKAELRWWNVEGLPEATGDYTDTGFYIQIKFDGCLQTRCLAHNARQDMIQIPVRSFNGWGISPGAIPIELSRTAGHTKFDVDLYTEGLNPSRLTVPAGATLRVCVWIKIETEL